MNEQYERARRARLMDDFFVRQCVVKSQELSLQPADPERKRLAEICEQLTAMQDALGYLPLEKSLPKSVYGVMSAPSSRLGSVIALVLKRF